MNAPVYDVKLVAQMFAMLLAVLVLGLPGAQAQATGKPTAQIVVTRLNVRAGPGTGYAILRMATAGEQVRVIGQQDNCAWLKVVDSNGSEGWVSGQSRFVSLAQSCAAIGAASSPATAASQATVAPTQQPAPIDQSCRL